MVIFQNIDEHRVVAAAYCANSTGWVGLNYYSFLSPSRNIHVLFGKRNEIHLSVMFLLYVPYCVSVVLHDNCKLSLVKGLLSFQAPLF